MEAGVGQSLLRGLLFHPEVTVGPGGHLGEVGDHQDLVLPGDLAEPLGHGVGHHPPDPRVDLVEDLVRHAMDQDPGFLAERQAVALDEPLLRDQLLTSDGEVSAINVVLQYPEKDLMEVPQAVEYARGLAKLIETDYPHIEVHLTGVSMLNNAFAETDSEGHLLRLYTFPGQSQEGLALDPEGHLYIAQDSGGILKIRWRR